MSHLSVLIVDDNEADRFLLKHALEQSSIKARVFEREHGGEGLDFFRDLAAAIPPGGSARVAPTVVFLDINMPICDGFGFLDGLVQLRSEHPLDRVSVAMFTSSCDPGEIERAISYDFVVDCIQKSELDASGLRDIVGRCQPELAASA